MDLISILIVFLILGAIVYLIRLLPIAEPFRTGAIALVIAIALIYLLSLLPSALRGL
jgi:hypothetical protein